jgi:lipopolysaccharide/colanic/teichoic acid biosynthesis glycosyltransferase
MKNASIYKLFGKRITDLMLSILGIIITLPILILVGFKIKEHDSGPIFYKGKRIKKGQASFNMFKFRTMVINADSVGPSSTSEKDPRITPIGHFIRKYKIDEIPQLFNIFLGDMSFVGPRPDTKEMTDLFNETEKKILTVRPGITDYASIVFRDEGGMISKNALENEDADETYLRIIAPDKHRLNLHYIRDCSIFTDLKLIIATAGAVVGIGPEWALPEDERVFSIKINSTE